MEHVLFCIRHLWGQIRHLHNILQTTSPLKDYIHWKNWKGKKKSLETHKTEIPIFKQKREVEGLCEHSFGHWASSRLFSDCSNDLKYPEINVFCVAKVAQARLKWFWICWVTGENRTKALKHHTNVSCLATWYLQEHITNIACWKQGYSCHQSAVRHSASGNIALRGYRLSRTWWRS